MKLLTMVMCRAAMDLSDGLNYFASLTGFEDGFYQAKLVLTHGQSGDEIGRPGEVALAVFTFDGELCSIHLFRCG